MNKFFRVLLLIILVLTSFTCNAYALENTYKIYNFDGTSDLLLETESFDEAYSFYINNKNDYKNLCLYEGEDVLYMEYGTLYINSNEDKVSYYSIIKERDVEISNFNEYDLLYIGEDEFGVKFVLENDIGYIDKSLLMYCPYGTRSISFYDLYDGSIYHRVSSLINDYYKYNLMLDEALPFMKDNVKYFSYDGHFFYDDFYLMSDDYALGIKDNALNKDDPYFNYYAYLPLRSYTNYSADDFNTFIKNTLNLTGRLYNYSDKDRDGSNDLLDRSELYGTGKAFVSSEKIYGVNALSSLALSLVESNYGKSLNAYKYSNLYNHMALSENENVYGKYSSINNSIYSHARNFASRNYCDMFATFYKGSFMGDFISGLGASYSNNPLFSEMYTEKAYFIDKNLGLKDKNEYTLAITSKNLSLYYGPDLSITYKVFINYPNNSFIILENGDGYYKVQADYSMNQSGEYNPNKSVLYLNSDNIEHIIDGRCNNFTYNEYKIDYHDISDDGIITLYSKKEIDINKEYEYKDIDGIDISSYTLVDGLYKPIYKKIKDIEVEGLKYPFIMNDEAYIKDGKLKIIYNDNTSKKISLTSNNIGSIKNEDNKTKLQITYKGFKKDINLNGNFSINNPDKSLDDFVQYARYNPDSFYFDNIKAFDSKFVLDETIASYIRDNEFDFSFEGANPNFIYYQSDLFPKIINTYYFNVKRISDNAHLNSVLKNFNLSYVDSFNISVTRSLYNIEFISPIIMQTKLSKIDDSVTYSVYHKNSDGSFSKVPTEFSNNYVRFIAYEGGDYYIYKYKGASSYDIKDSLLSNTIEDNGKDYYDLVVDGLLFFIFVSIGYAIIALYYILKRKEIKPWKEFKNLLLKAESHPEEKQKL